jgi:hypothetical protein
MTRQWRETVPCPKCGMRVSTESAFDRWVRNHERLDSVRDGVVITDGDKHVHRCHIRVKGESIRDVQYLMDIEVKAFGRDMTDSQRDTLHIHNQLLRTNGWKKQLGRFLTGHEQNVRNVFSSYSGKHVQVIHYGVHKLRMTGADPVTSDRITWDDKQIDVDQLVGLLRFDVNPDSLRPMEHRRHKRIDDRAPTLFGEDSR